MGKAATPKKSLFTAGVFDGLEAATMGGTGNAPLRVLLADIDEDPEQPRTTFDQGKLEQLAETITLLGGVLQPIGLRAPVDGRYMLVFGARRYRASRLLGLADIPAVVVAGEQAGLAAQVIENQSRADLFNSDLAAVVKRLGAGGMKGKEIGTVCGLTDHFVTMFRSVSRLPSFLAARLNDGDMRAIYELFTAWQKQPAEIEGAMEGHDTALSVTEARRLIEDATGRTTSSIYLKPKAEAVASVPLPVPQENEDTGPELPGIVDEVEAPAPVAPTIVPVPAARPAPSIPPVSAAPTGSAAPVTAPAPAARAVQAGLPVFIMETAAGQRGVLVTSRRAGTKGHVLLDVDGAEIEAAFAELRPVDTD
jgi:ParB family chromosome partitioning protein